MSLDVTPTKIKNVLTRTSGYLKSVCSHSLQPYRGCTFGNALCGVGCYVQHNGHVLKGRRWGGFLEVRTNAAESYLAHYEREARWARRRTAGDVAGLEPCGGSGGPDLRRPPGATFGVFLSSATDPFVPQEFRFGITRAVLEAMLRSPPDELILQTHSHRVTAYLDLYRELARRCALRVHVSIESDRDRLPGLPAPASSVSRRFEACAMLKDTGLRTVVTVSPLLPIADPERFFARVAETADAVVLDHYIEGDGTADGRRTARTSLPAAMRHVDPDSVTLAYRDRMVAIARRFLPGRVGVNVAGFAGRYDAG